MPKIFKKFLLSFLVSLIVLFSFAPFLTAKAAPEEVSTWYNQDFKSWYGKVYDPDTASEIFGERYTAAQVQWVVYGLWGFLINTVTGPENAPIVQCFLNGAVDLNTCQDAINALVASRKTPNNMAAAPSKNENLWSLVFADRPLSGISYVREKFGSFKLVPEVHAQTKVGFGFNALKPIQGMWKAFRDIAFGLFVIVAVVFAFMIMFRVKLSPQTVISVQSALPKIVTALILVTFSYAIAGFLVDLMYVVIGLISVAAAQIYEVTLGIKGVATVGFGATPYFKLLTLGQPLGWNIQFSVLGLIGIYFAMFFLPLFIFLLLLSAGLALTGIGSTAALIVLVVAMILYIIAVIVALWTGVKVIWALLKAFANIVLLTIFAPIHLALGTIVPSLGFGQWLRSFVSNLAVFIVTGTLFLFSFLFIIQGVIIGATGAAKEILLFFLGPFLGALASSIPALDPHSYPAWPPLLGSGGDVATGLLFLGVSFVLFTLTPKANEIIQGLLSGKPFAYGTAIGEAFGGVGMAYGASGARDVVEMSKKAYRQGQLEAFFQNYNSPSGATGLARTVQRIENLPVVGKYATNIRSKVEAGSKPHSS